MSIDLPGNIGNPTNVMYSGFCAESEGVSIPGGWLCTELSGTSNMVGMRWSCRTLIFMFLSVVFMLDIYQTNSYNTKQ